MNHRGWVVLESISSTDGSLCVDFFIHPDGWYGFELFRSDPEDRGRWVPIGGFSSTSFSSAIDAVAAAGEAVDWLGGEAAPRSALDRWRQQVERISQAGD